MPVRSPAKGLIKAPAIKAGIYANDTANAPPPNITVKILASALSAVSTAIYAISFAPIVFGFLTIKIPSVKQESPSKK